MKIETALCSVFFGNWDDRYGITFTVRNSAPVTQNKSERQNEDGGWDRWFSRNQQ